MKSRAYKIIICALFAALIAVGAFIRVPVPVIPFTMQTLFVCLAGMILGHKLGAISAFVYMFIGLIGIPVFTQGGGIGYVLKPTFGYIIGFIAAAFVVGLIVKNYTKPSYTRLLMAGLAGIMTIYIIGVPYFYLISTLYLEKAVTANVLLLNCFLFTLPGDIVTVALGALVARRVIPIVKKHI